MSIARKLTNPAVLFDRRMVFLTILLTNSGCQIQVMPLSSVPQPKIGIKMYQSPTNFQWTLRNMNDMTNIKNPIILTRFFSPVNSFIAFLYFSVLRSAGMWRIAINIAVAIINIFGEINIGIEVRGLARARSLCLNLVLYSEKCKFWLK